MFICAVWTAVPLYHRDWAEFKARLSQWFGILLMGILCGIQYLTTTALRWITRNAMTLSGVRQKLAADGLAVRLLDESVPNLVVLIASIALMLCVWRRSKKRTHRNRKHVEIGSQLLEKSSGGVEA